MSEARDTYNEFMNHLDDFFNAPSNDSNIDKLIQYRILLASIWHVEKRELINKLEERTVYFIKKEKNLLIPKIDNLPQEQKTKLFCMFFLYVKTEKNINDILGILNIDKYVPDVESLNKMLAILNSVREQSNDETKSVIRRSILNALCKSGNSEILKAAYAHPFFSEFKKHVALNAIGSLFSFKFETYSTTELSKRINELKK